MQWEVLMHAKRAQRQIVMAWLDLENAYGSIRHMLVQFVKWYHVPQKVSELLFRYYDAIFLTVDWSSDFFSSGYRSTARMYCLYGCVRCCLSGGFGYVEVDYSRCESLLPFC